MAHKHIFERAGFGAVLILTALAAAAPRPAAANVTTVPLYHLTLEIRPPNSDPSDFVVAWMDHLYTISVQEMQDAKNGKWQNAETTCYILPSPVKGTIPLYKLYREHDDGKPVHLYLTDKNDLQEAKKKWGYRYVGIAGFVIPADRDVPGTVPLYHYWEPNFDMHAYSTDPTAVYGNYKFGKIECRVWTSAIEVSPIPDPPVMHSIPSTIPAPSNLTAVSVSADQIVLTWKCNSQHEDGVEIYRSDAVHGEGLLVKLAAWPGSGHVTSYADKGLKVNVKYTYRVRAYTGSKHSALSNMADATPRARKLMPQLTRKGSKSLSKYRKLK